MKNYVKDHSTDPYQAISPYGKFHFAFIGYSFQSKDTGNVLTKSAFWDMHRHEAMLSSKNGICPDGFVLVDSEGWKDGKIISEY